MTRVMRAGFTLLELLIVITIIGLLAAMALPRFGDLGTSAADASAAAVAGALGASAADYHAKCDVGLGPCSSLNCSAATLASLVSGIRAADFTVGGAPGSGCAIRHARGSVTYYSARID